MNAGWLALRVGDVVTSQALPGHGTYVLAGYCAVGESRRAVLVPSTEAASLDVTPRPVAGVLVAPSTLEPSPWAVAATASDGGARIARQPTP